MNTSTPPNPVHIVLCGGGHSHVEVLRKFGMNPDPNVRLTVISDHYHAPYSGMLPGFIAGHYDYDESHIDLAPLVTFAGARLFHDRVTGFDLEEQKVRCANRPPVTFDLLSINIGSTPQVADIPGAREHALPAKPVDRFIERWEQIRERALAASDTFRVLTIGGGAGGVELALTMRHYLHARRPDGHYEFHLATDTGTILPTHNAGVQRRMQKAFTDRGITIHTDHRAIRVTENEVEFENGNTLRHDALIWVTQASAPQWLSDTGLALNDRGFIAINDNLRSTSHDNVFAVGDVATLATDPTPKSGVFAVRQGPVLYENLRRAAAGQPPEKYHPQRQFLGLISTGNQYAIASRGPFSLEGEWVWKWKDRIDTRWMAKYHDLPPMTMPAPATMDDEMHCGGCGCKVGGSMLTEVLTQLQEQYPNAAPDQLDDAAIVSPPSGQSALQTIDFFRSFIDDPFVFGQVAANHALNDIFAMGAHPREALAIVTLPYGDERHTAGILHDVLAGALEVLTRHNTRLVGGHTTEGPDLVFGLSVTGYADPSTLLTKGGLNPGDHLILTKPLGTGALFAGAMRGKAKGRWIGAAIESMLIDSAQAATIARDHDATACTDITGFGLAGHLLEMLSASACSASIARHAIPLLPGAHQLISEDITSSLHDRNARAATKIEGPVNPILFDPQTAGGLLVGVPASRSAACTDALKAHGYESAVDIGVVGKQLTAGPAIRITD